MDILDVKIRILKKVLLLISLLVLSFQGYSQVTREPSFHIDYEGSFFNTPTADKPQSKMWFMDKQWWALLPGASGPTLWQRTATGWFEHKEVNASLKGTPGKVDVYYHNRKVTAVGVSDTSLFVYRLIPNGNTNEKWSSKILTQLRVPDVGFKPQIETATITKDAGGKWWVVADVGNSVYAWFSRDSKKWSKGIAIGKNLDPDDISSITSTESSVIAIWSNQNTETIYSREHLNGKGKKHWNALQIVESGEKTADDHINTTMTLDGTLWVTTKNSVDKVDEPIFVLRVRTPNGKWRNFPYEIFGKYFEPSRPIIMSSLYDQSLILEAHTHFDLNNRVRSTIDFGIIDTTKSDILINKKTIIAPKHSLKAIVNNVTSSKAPFPKEGPWLVLASDNKGNIYEADLRVFLEEK